MTVHPSAIDVMIWVTLLCCVLGCIATGAEAAEARNGAGVVWWALILLITLAALSGFTYALAVSG